MQFVVYSYTESLAARRAERAAGRRRHRAVRSPPLPAALAAAAAAAATARPAAAASLGRRGGREAVRPPPPPPPPPPQHASRHTAGLAVAWVSAAFYLGSRVSQLAKNATRGSAEGLALSMFGSAIAANLFYAASIVLRARNAADLAAAAPWLAGSLGTIALDVAIFGQARALARRTAARAAARRARRAARVARDEEAAQLLTTD